MSILRRTTNPRSSLPRRPCSPGGSPGRTANQAMHNEPASLPQTPSAWRRKSSCGSSAGLWCYGRSIHRPAILPETEVEDRVFGEPHTWDAGIAQVGASRAPDTTISVAATIFNSDVHSHTFDLEFYADDRLEDVQSVTVQAGSTASLTHPAAIGNQGCAGPFGEQ